MPFYEYECAVHKIIEVQQSINDPVLEECPICREENNICSNVKKLISLSTFHLSGGGWADSGYNK